MAVRDFLNVSFASDDVIEMRWMGLLDGQQVMTTHHYRVFGIGGNNLGDAYTLWLNDFEEEVWQKVQPLLSNELTGVILTVQKVFPTRFRMQSRAATPSAGAVASASLPSGVTVVTRRQGNIASRTNQGRIYTPGIPIASTDGSKLTPVALAPFRANVDDSLLAPLLPLDDAELQPIIFNLKAPVVTRDARFAITDDILRYQRRREIGVGV